MLKKSLFLTLLLLFSITTFAFAHTGLESSSPKKGETIDSDLKEITLTFEGKLEKGSSFTLESDSGNSIPVENMTIEKNLLTGKLLTTPENGDYIIHWSIIGADGHLIDGEIPFTIALPTVEENSSNAIASQNTANEQSAVDENTETEETKSGKSASTLTNMIIIGLVLILLGSMIALYKRKK